MKKTIAYVLAAATVVIGLVSCSKEKLPETESEKVQEKEQEKPQQGLRTLTVSFAAGTKTTLGANDQPVWAEGDKISLNGVDHDVPKEAYGKSSCTITTDITGTINAVYPADAYVSESPYYKVADGQNGSFGSANICFAQVGSGETTIRFNNVTAVFEVKVPAHTKELIVTSLGEIDATTGQRGQIVRPINTTGKDDAAKQKITVNVKDSASATTCYVSVMVDGTNPVLLTNLNFDAVTGDNTGAQGGVSPSYIKSKDVNNPLAYKVAVNTIYTPELHEYVKIGGKKWSTRNVGATADKGPDSYGRYFMWGETTGLTSDKINSTNFPDEKYYSADNKNEWSKAGCFCWNNCPWTDGVYEDSNKKVFTKYIPSDSEAATFSKDGKADGKTTLDLVDDAAWFNWGGAWRMPTGGYGFNKNTTDFLELVKVFVDGYVYNDKTTGVIKPSSLAAEPSQKGIYYYNVSGEEGLYFFVDNQVKLFFPDAGRVVGEYNAQYKTQSSYWSSNVDFEDSNFTNWSNCFMFYSPPGSGNTDTTDILPYTHGERYFGCPVRPVSD